MKISTQQNIVLTVGVVAVILSLSGIAYSDSLLPEYEITWFDDKVIMDKDGNEYECGRNNWHWSRCGVIIIEQNERIIDLLEKLVEK